MSLSELNAQIATLEKENQRLASKVAATSVSEKNVQVADTNGDGDGGDGINEDQVQNSGEDVDKRKLTAYDAVIDKVRKLPKNKRIKVVQQVTSPAKLKRLRVTSQLARDIRLDRRAISSINQGPVKRYAKSIRVKQGVLAFLQLPEHSITLPGKKDTVTVKKKNKQKGVLTQFTAPLHKAYNQQNPEQQCSISFFRSVRRQSRFIKPLDYGTNLLCLCLKHQNYTLKLRALASTGIPVVPDTLVKQMDLKALMEKLSAAAGTLPSVIKFQEWRKIPVPYGDPEEGKSTTKLRPVDKHLPRKEFVQMVLAEYPSIREHVIRASHQHREIRSLRERLTQQECTIQMDFAQNWMVSYHEEVQSAFFAKDAITVHPVVIHLRDKDGKIYTDSLCVASDDKTHDAGAILAILDVITSHIKNKHPEVSVVHYCSDSPSSQYQNISMFSVICRHKELFGLTCTWSYFESGHGKGPCDGVGAAAKRKADQALMRNVAIFNAADFVNEGNKEGSITSIHVPAADSFEARRCIPSLASKKKVPGTMQVHEIVVTKPSVAIAVRSKACFKECCWSGLDAKNGCGGWKEFTLFNTSTGTQDRDTENDTETEIVTLPKATGTEEGTEEGTDHGTEYRGTETITPSAANANFQLNDFIAAMYKSEWYIGKVVGYLREDDELL